MAQNAETIFRDFVSDGVPSSGANMPKKVEIREWGTYIEQLHAAAQAGGGVVFQTKAAMTLGYAANQIAWVVADPIAASNGIYQKQGGSGSGSWTRVADLPYSFIRASNSGAGAANAIVATTGIPLPAASYGALILMNVASANSGPVTLAINGAAAKPLVTISGNALAAGYLLAGMLVAFVDAGTNFRLLTDVASSTIQAAAEAAAIAAKADADRADAAAGVAIGAMTTVIDPQFATKATAEAFRPVLAPDYIRTAGYAAAGDGGGALYKKVAVQPTHAGKLSITLLGGAVVWYELAEEVFTPKNFGIRIAPDDASTDIQRALDTAAEKGSAVRIPPGTYWAKDITLKAPIYGVPGASTIKCLSGATMLFTGASGTGPVLMRDLILDGNLEAVRALQCTENSKVRIKDVDWINWGGAWVADFLQGTRDVAINGGLFKGNKGSNNLVIRGQYGRVLSVRFEDIESHAIRFGRYNSDTAGNSGYYGSVIGCSFSNIRNDTVLLELDTRWVVVSGNVAERVRRFIKAQSADASGIAGRLTVSNNIINGQVPAASDGVSLGAAIGIENAVIGAVVHDNQIYGFDQGITFGPQAIIHHNHLENITGRGMWGNGAADVQIDHNTFKNHTGDYAINPTGARANVSNNNIATTGTGIRLEGARSKAMFNDIAAATGIQLTSGAPTSQVGGNDLSRVTGTKVLDAATGTVSNPPNITA